MLALVVLTACRDSSAGEARTTVPTRPPTSSTTATTAVSYDVPAVIDAAYVEKVMAALDHVEGEAARYLASKRQLDEDWVRFLAAIYDSKAMSLTQQAWLKIAGNEYTSLSERPGDPVTTVERLLLVSTECIVFEATRDFSALFKEPDPPRPQRYVALVPTPPGRNPGSYNPTPWIMSFDGRFKDGGEPTQADVCTSS